MAQGYDEVTTYSKVKYQDDRRLLRAVSEKPRC